MPLSEGPTPFAELNEIFGRLVDGARRALADDFIGAYLVGSFALGDADIHSDCDFIVATGGPIPPAQEEAIRRLRGSRGARPSMVRPGAAGGTGARPQAHPNTSPPGSRDAVP
ncbi:MAG: nucleotidyltransferase domain-containing protein [Actinomycetota bacterium]|nr:nucleotidyltransferase domain-containing protein [Actinomycetota bacterium]